MLKSYIALVAFGRELFLHTASTDQSSIFGYKLLVGERASTAGTEEAELMPVLVPIGQILEKTEANSNSVFLSRNHGQEWYRNWPINSMWLSISWDVSLVDFSDYTGGGIEKVSH